MQQGSQNSLFQFAHSNVKIKLTWQIILLCNNNIPLHDT